MTSIVSWLSQCEKHASLHTLFVEKKNLWREVSDAVSIKLHVCLRTLTFLPAYVSCVCINRFQRLNLSWGTSAAAVILCSEMETFSQHLHNISPRYKKHRRTLDWDFPLEQSVGFYFKQLFPSCVRSFSLGNLERFQAVHLFKCFKAWREKCGDILSVHLMALLASLKSHAKLSAVNFCSTLCSDKLSIVNVVRIFIWHLIIGCSANFYIADTND